VELFLWEVEVEVEVEGYPLPHLVEEEAEVEAEEALPEDHHPQMDDLKETHPSNSQEIEKGAKPSCLCFRSIKNADVMTNPY